MQKLIFQILGLALLLTHGVRAQSPVTADQATEQTKLTNARKTWDSRLYSDYEYRFSQSCTNCHLYAYPWIVQVTPGQPAAAVDSKYQSATGALSIAQVFDMLQTHLNNANDKIEATYDANNGYPTRYKVQYDIGSPQGQIIDATIYNFHTLDGSQKTLYQNARNLWASKRITNYDFEYSEVGPNPQNIQWPIFIKVRNNVITEKKDNNGNIINYSLDSILTIDQWFDQIKRELDSGAPYMDNVYNSLKGYAEEVFAVTVEGPTKYFTFINYKDTGLS